MYVTIEIHYNAESRITQSDSFQLRGKRPEQLALDFWKQIQKEMSYRATLEKVIMNGDHDITKLVKDLEEIGWKNAMKDDLPF